MSLFEILLFKKIGNGRKLIMHVTRNICAFVTVLLYCPALYTVCILPVTGQPFSSNGVGIAFSPLINNNIYCSIANTVTNTVTTFSVDTSTGPTSGVFTQIGTIATSGPCTGIAYSPLVNGKVFVAVTAFPIVGPNGGIDMYSVDANTGLLSAAPGSPFIEGSSPIVPAGVAFSPVVNNNLFLATANGTPHPGITTFRVNTTNGVISLVEQTVIQPNGTNGIAFSPIINNNLFVALTNSSTITVFSVNTSIGNLSNQMTFSQPQPNAIAYSPVVNQNLFAAVTNLSANNITSFQVNPNTGSFTQSTVASSNTNPSSVGFAPLVNNILLAGSANAGSNLTRIYSVNINNGALSELSASPFFTPSPIDIAFSPLVNQRAFFGTVNTNTTNNVGVYKIIYAPLLSSAILDCVTGLVTVTGSGVDTTATISVIADGVTFLGTGSPDAFGNFNFTTTIPLVNSNHVISVTQTIGGCMTELSNSFIFSAPNAPVLRTALRTGSSGLLIVTGTETSPGAMITIFSDGLVIGSGTSDASGNFNITSAVPVSPSSHVITVNQTVAGCVSDPSNPIILGPLIIGIFSTLLYSPLTRAIVKKYCPFIILS